MDDAIIVSGLEIKASVGVHEWEHRISQLLLLDIKLSVDLRRAGNTDDLDDTVDYQMITAIAKQVAEEKHHALIEHYSERLAQRILNLMPTVKQVSLAICKPGAIASTRTVSVQMHRTIEDYQS